MIYTTEEAVKEMMEIKGTRKLDDKAATELEQEAIDLESLFKQADEIGKRQVH